LTCRLRMLTCCVSVRRPEQEALTCWRRTIKDFDDELKRSQTEDGDWLQRFLQTSEKDLFHAKAVLTAFVIFCRERNIMHRLQEIPKTKFSRYVCGSHGCMRT
jgi:hypothetical protein